MTEELAIMKNVQFGVRDTNFASLWFSVSMLSCGALLSIPRDEVIKFIEDNQITDINNLNGRACVVDRTGNNVKFVRLK